MKYQRFVVGEIETNCYLLWSGKKAGVIDPGGAMDELVAYIDDHSFELCWIINTHGHVDHIAGNAELSRRYSAPIWIHASDRQMLTSARDNLSIFFGTEVVSPDAAKTLEDNEIFSLGEENLKVLETPGHTLGGITIYSDGLAFTGDALFYESIGRTDFPGGNYHTLIESIRRKLFTLPPETIVLPGHGSPTTIGHELNNNPFMMGNNEISD